ncbi:hypothetical protein EGH22_14500 [Halomicroarcula sp. F28]|uniref:hypothetical protein n=1 Tax=Haloarcula salinisoli TaxID=2487746 RepID=UPI001C730690|nr:hypothetical protein [Halomicroarcula salinisoli]MBX0287540.1 hypothetical protein [Halomicroarcula salinisoli]
MSGSDLEKEFRYDGQLVFNGLYSTEVVDAGINFEQVAKEQLTDFTKGSPDNPSKGYGLIPYSEYVENSSKLPSEIKQTAEDIRALRRKYEDWEVGETKEGEELEFRQTESYDIYWDFPEFLLIKGNKTQAKRASEIVDYQFSDYLKAVEIEFDPYFLQWLFYRRHADKTNLRDNLTINMLRDAEIEGEREDRYGKRNQVDKSTDVTKSLPILLGILDGKDITSLEGIFDVRGNFVAASIELGGRVHVKVEQAIEDVEPISRMTLAILFIRELLSLYNQWESMSLKEKYPPDEFFLEVAEECKRQGSEPTFSFDNVIKENRQLRTQGSQNDTQAGLSDFS